MVVKSVYATFTVEWIAERYAPKVVVMERNLVNVVASWLALDIRIGDLERSDAIGRLSDELQLPPHNPEAPRHERVAWCVAFLSVAMKHTVARHPDWLTVSHHRLVSEPEQEFSRIFASLALPWTDEASRRIIASNHRGRGYETARVRSELSQAWRHRISLARAAEVQAVFSRFRGLQNHDLTG